MKKCWDPTPDNRPKAYEVRRKIELFYSTYGIYSIGHSYSIYINIRIRCFRLLQNLAYLFFFFLIFNQEIFRIMIMKSYRTVNSEIDGVRRISFRIYMYSNNGFGYLVRDLVLRSYGTVSN